MSISAKMTIQLEINPDLPISSIQKEFNTRFPFLKLEFFSPRAWAESDFSARRIIPGNKKIKETYSSVQHSHIEIDEGMKVKELETFFKDQFNIPVQVFRKSGNLWLETTITDKWTLEHQNEHGREISEGNKGTAHKADEYDLNRDADH